MATVEWTVQLSVDARGDLTEAVAVLEADGVERAHGLGQARRNPADAEHPRIGEELAVSRALYALADRLSDIAAADVALADGRG
jgi:hypothetical protein